MFFYFGVTTKEKEKQVRSLECTLIKRRLVTSLLCDHSPSQLMHLQLKHLDFLEVSKWMAFSRSSTQTL